MNKESNKTGPSKVTRSQSTDTRANQNKITLEEFSKLDKNSPQYRELSNLVKDNLRNSEFEPNLLKNQPETRELSIQIPKLTPEQIENPFGAQKTLIHSPTSNSSTGIIPTEEIHNIPTDGNIVEGSILFSDSDISNQNSILNQTENSEDTSTTNNPDNINISFKMAEAKLTYRDAVMYLREFSGDDLERDSSLHNVIYI